MTLKGVFFLLGQYIYGGNCYFVNGPKSIPSSLVKGSAGISAYTHSCGLSVPRCVAWPDERTIISPCRLRYGLVLGP